MPNKQKELKENYYRSIVTHLKLFTTDVRVSYGRLFSKYIYPNRLVIILLFSLFFMFSRNTDLLLRPQLWGEDGKYFFADAYSKGMSSILIPYAGFFQGFLRVGGLIASYIGIQYTPLFFSLISYLLMLMPLFILWTDEQLLFGKGKNKQLIVLAILYLLLPMHWETLGNLTNVGWYLAMSAILVLLRDGKNSKKWKWFDISILAVSGLTGPYALLFLLPILYLWSQKRSNRLLRIKLIVVLVCVLVQVIAMISSPVQKTETTRSQVKTLVKEQKRPFQVVGMRFIVQPVMQSNSLQYELAYSDQVYLLGILILAMWLFIFVNAPANIKALGFFGLSSFLVMLFRVTGETRLFDHWNTMQISDLGARYLLIPIFCWIVILIFYSRSSNGFIKHLSVAFLVMYLLALPLSYQLKSIKYKFFSSQQKEFRSLQSGENYCFDENPDGWQMCLVKK